MSNPDEQKVLLDSLQRSGHPEALAEASQLEWLYHDRQMGGLAADVYDAAKDEGQPPAGWIRVSDHPEALSQYASSIGVSAKELLDELHPENSGFRAEIYLPDEHVLGPGYKPVVAFKGSSGEVMTSKGLRETGTEDFVANNFPQSVGLETESGQSGRGPSIVSTAQFASAASADNDPPTWSARVVFRVM